MLQGLRVIYISRLEHLEYFPRFNRYITIVGRGLVGWSTMRARRRNLTSKITPNTNQSKRRDITYFFEHEHFASVHYVFGRVTTDTREYLLSRKAVALPYHRNVI